ncbi:MAG: hypothetical protein C0622_05625 [Desulfuromonas sp.]|nr:MAG: hypothetical protein C0622_05625 [Desulfuromonas sp.]
MSMSVVFSDMQKPCTSITKKIVAHLISTLMVASLVLFFLPASSSADDNLENESDTVVLPVVTVTATAPDILTQKEIIDRDTLSIIPATNGNLTEAFKTVPGVQYSESFESSKTGGEIEPPEISISGGRPEDNNFILDSIGNNSLLDPAFKDTTNYNNVPGNAQEMFLLDHLINTVDIYRANISARYGAFNGGVIETNSIDPTAEFSGRISFRMTDSSWGEFHIDPAEQEAFYNSNQALYQPKFSKYQFSATLNVPVNDYSGLLFDYSRLQSTIPLQHFDQEVSQHRINENIFLKYVTEPQTGTKLTLSGSYMPYEGKYFLKNAMYSDYSLLGGGYKLSGQLEKRLALGQLEFNLGYQKSWNSRVAPPDWYSWRVSDLTEEKDWGAIISSKTSWEGGYGDIDKEQETLVGNIHMAFDAIKFGKQEHQINAGAEISATEAVFNRPENMSVYSVAKINGSVICPEGSFDCVQGEQFMYFMNDYPEDHAEANITNYSAYLEDNLSFGKFDLRPGIHLSYDDLQNNLNAAPRLAASYDPFGDRNTIFIAGVNRYYGASLLTLALEEQKLPYEVYMRSTVLDSSNFQPQPWPEDPRPRKSIDASRTGDLKTPYADEWTAGIRQQVWGGTFAASYINRVYKDQIVSVTLDMTDIDPDDPYSYKEWRNSGHRDYEELTFEYSKEWEKSSLYFNIGWSKNRSNSSSYASSFTESLLDVEAEDINFVWYGDKLIDRSQLPADNFSRPVKASLVYNRSLPYGFSFTNTTNYRGRYKALVNTNKSLDGYDIYAVVRKPSALTFDWRLSWMSPEYHGNTVELTLDILNLFNKRIAYGPSEENYLLGRQIWGGITYNF